MSYSLPNLIHHWQFEPSRYSKLFKILGILPLLLLGLSFINSAFIFLLISTFAVNIFVHYSQKKKLEFFLEPFSQLISLRKVSLRIMNMDKQLLVQEVEEASQELRKIDRYYFLLAKGASEQNEFLAIFSLLLEYLKITFLLEVNVLDDCIRLVASRKDAIHTLYTYIGKLDAAQSVASFRHSLP